MTYIVMSGGVKNVFVNRVLRILGPKVNGVNRGVEKTTL
jgi:hypothetical protein